MTTFVTSNAPYIALAILAPLFVAFTLERYPPEVTASAAAALFIVLGLVPTDDVMDVFSNSVPITIAAMFVVSGARRAARSSPSRSSSPRPSGTVT